MLTSSMVRGRGIVKKFGTQFALNACQRFSLHTSRFTRTTSFHTGQCHHLQQDASCEIVTIMDDFEQVHTSQTFLAHHFSYLTFHFIWQDLLSSHPSHGANCAAVAAATETSAQQTIQEPVKHSSPNPVPPRSRSKLFLNSPQPPPRQYVGDSCTGADLAGTDDNTQCSDDPPAPPPPASNSARNRRQPPLLHTIQPSQLKILHKIGTFSRTHHSCALHTLHPFEIAKCSNCVSQYCTV